MSYRNPHHPEALGRHHLAIGTKLAWYSHTGREVKRATVVGPVFGSVKLWVPLQVTKPIKETRPYELAQMGIIPHPDTEEECWAPSYTLAAEPASSLVDAQSGDTARTG